MKNFILFLIMLSTQAQAAKHLAYLGGSGDPVGETTIFDSKISDWGQFSRSANYAVNVAFDGGHSTTEQILRNSFSASTINDFTASSYDTLIANYEKQINDGTIKSGDQLLVVMDTHGSKRYPPLATHSIAVGRGEAVDLNNLQGSETATMDRLQRLAQLAQQKNIRLGIVDFSCHSGASLPLANSNTCVVTSSGPESFAFGGSNRDVFSNVFSKGMRPGRTLEDVFLEARESSRDLGFPMISTATGRSVQDRLYPVLRRYINYRAEKSDKLSEDVLESVKSGSCQQENADVERILSLSREIEEIQSVDLSAFRSALTDYHQYRQTLQNELNGLGIGLLKEKRKFCDVPSLGCNELDVELILTMNPDINLGEYRRQLANARTPAERTRNQQWIAYFENVKATRQEIIQAHPGLGRFTTFFQNYPDIERRSTELANRVGVESRKLYSSLYQRDRGPDPCRDFVL